MLSPVYVNAYEGYLSAATHDANHAREGSSSGRSLSLLRDLSRIAEAVLSRDRG
jgi:hypothetical protein